ncbi:MAG: hypothetical protein ABFD86_17865, partial [Bryobacteraceae bacterium]
MREVTDEQLKRWVKQIDDGYTYSWEWPTLLGMMKLMIAAREREAGLLALVERLRGFAEKIDKKLLDLQNEDVEGVDDSDVADGWFEASKDMTVWCREALSLTPPAALEALRARLTAEEGGRWVAALRKAVPEDRVQYMDGESAEEFLVDWLEALRRREREEALREAADRIGPEYGEHQAAWALRKMADAIAAERK